MSDNQDYNVEVLGTYSFDEVNFGNADANFCLHQ